MDAHYPDVCKRVGLIGDIDTIVADAADPIKARRFDPKICDALAQDIDRGESSVPVLAPARAPTKSGRSGGASGYGNKACASSQSRRTTSAAGSARANAADCPAQACIRCTSWAPAPASRITAVSPRCTG
jgi:hypothetical protein